MTDITAGEFKALLRKAKAEYEGGNKRHALTICATLAPFVKAHPVAESGYNRQHDFKLMLRYLKYEIMVESKGGIPWAKE